MKSRPLREYLDAEKTAQELRRSLGTNLKEARIASGYSQYSLAEEADTSQEMISMVETGRRSPTVPLLEKLIEVLDGEGGKRGSKGAKRDAQKARGKKKEGD